MGDETTQFASRFSNAVTFLAALAEGARDADLAKRHGTDLPAAVRGALDAVEAVYATETGAVRDWPEQRKRVLAQVASLRGALAASGVGEDVRRLARALVRLLDPVEDAAPRGGARRPRGG